MRLPLRRCLKHACLIGGKQSVSNVPAIYTELKSVALDCIQDIRFDDEARTTFASETVRRVLDGLMDSILEALELISSYYSQTSGGK